MTVRSMTGFGQASGENASCRIEAKIRGFNHRFLDLVIRLPDELRSWETSARELLVERLQRGRVELAVEVQYLGRRKAEVEVAREVLESLDREVETLVEQGLLGGRLVAGDLLRLPDLLRLRWQPPPWSAEDRALFLRVVGEALGQMSEARVTEGRMLARSLEDRLQQLGDRLGLLASRRGEIQESLLASLRQRLDNFLEGRSLPEERLLQEVAILAERSDVSEELERLSAHVESFAAIMKEDGAIGKRLDFLAQEVFREINTLASKTRDIRMIEWVLDAKMICEQLREQLQNVE